MLSIVIATVVFSCLPALEPKPNGAATAAELQQQWVNDTRNTPKNPFPPIQPDDLDFGKNSSKSLFSALPHYEEIGVDRNLSPAQKISQTQVSEESESDEHLLAQRGLLNRSEAPIRSGLSRLQTIVSPEETGRTNPNVRTAYYEWFDSKRGRSVPVKIYSPVNLHENCPTILFSHGLGGANENCDYLGEYWAFNGYISVFIHHYGSDDSVWKGKARPLNELRNAYDSHWTGRSRVLDIQFVLSQLEKYSEQQADLPLRWIDTKRIGAAGYDLGALASLLMVGQVSPEGSPLIHYPQIKAVLAMSPPVVNSEPFSSVYGQIETPCLFITGTNDDGMIGTTKAAQRRIPFDSITCNDQYLVIFDGTDHMLYAGHLLSILPRARNDALYQNAIARLSTNFWNAYLKEDPNALEFMMSRNVIGLLDGLGRIERKFYLRERRDVSSGLHHSSEKKEGVPPFASFTEPHERHEVPQYLSVPRSPYLENHSPPRQLRNTGALVPRRLPARLP